MAIGLSLCYFFCIVCLSATSSEDDTKITGKTPTVNSWTSYKNLFQVQRKAQMDAIKSILAITSNEKLHDMLTAVTSKVIEMLNVSREVLEKAGFLPTDEFPKDEHIRDSLSTVIQNSVFLGDLTLRFPTYVHRVFDRNSAIKDLVKWAFEFTNKTEIVSGSSIYQAINLASQELNIIPREENYVNPFLEEAEIKLSDLVKEEMKKKSKVTQKSKGPRITRRTEL